MRLVIPGLTRPRKLRATDADRDAYGDIVSRGYAEGQLDATTFEYRSSKVLNAKTIGELEDLVADLVTPEDTSKLQAQHAAATVSSLVPDPVKRQLKITGVAVLVVIVGSGLVAAAAINAATQSSVIQPIFPGVDVDVPALDWDPGPEVDMYTPDGLQVVVDDIVAAAGSPMFAWLGLYGEYALARGPGADGATRMADYDWRDVGEITKSSSPLDLEDGSLFDVTKDVDLAAVATLAASAPELTGVLEPTSLYVSIDRDRFSADRLVHVRVSLSNEYQDGYITADHTGEIITIEGPAQTSSATRFFEAENASRAVEVLQARIGHTEVTEVRFYGEYVAAEAPPEAGAEVIDGYEYRGGSVATRDSYTPIQPDDVRAAVFDITGIDGSVVAQSINAAPGDAELDGAEVSMVYVQRPLSPSGHDPVIVVVVHTDYESTQVFYSLTGELLQVG